MVQIAAARLKGNLLEEGNWKKQMRAPGKNIPLHAPRCGYSPRWQQISCRAV